MIKVLSDLQWDYEKMFLRCLPMVLLFVVFTGCVTRKFTIDSFPQGAMVYKDGKPIGVTPMDEHFVYYGKYNFKLVKDGYETLDVEQKVPSPWYEYPPLDFVAESLFPFEIHDIHRFSYALQPAKAVRQDEILEKAAELRERGKAVVPFAPVPEKTKGKMPLIGGN